MTTLIVTEKPNVAERIAKSIGNPTKKSHSGIAYYEVDGIYVAPAVGHIFGLRERESKGWIYPVFDIEWAPSYKVSKASEFTRNYLENIQELAEQCDTFVNACDYDIEGEVIGFNCIKHACKADPYSGNVKRMKYSTLTKESIIKAFENLEPTNKGMAEAGITRHILDWYWGINLSRALSNSARKARRYVTLSIGRVQGPTLKILASREHSIQSFKPEPYWQVEMISLKDKKEFSSLHEKDKFTSETEAKAAKEKCGHKATVKDVVKKQFKQEPPFPFDLTTLQTEAYKHLGIDPRRTLEIAQDLYTSAYISYPRTSSQQIPKDIDCRKIITHIMKQSSYADLCKTLLQKKELSPNNGEKKDPAHPAIHPTGEVPEKLEGQHARIYDLIVRRFLAAFGEHAVRQTINVKLDNNAELFDAKGTTTVEKGWHVYYGKYAKFEEVELPDLSKGEIVAVKDVIVHAKETKPPARYTPASIIREMEKRNIGTKATRSQIVDILFKRGYVDGKALEVSSLGLNVVDTLSKYCPEVLSDKLTRKFEEDMEEIQNNKRNSSEVIEDGKQTLTKILEEFKKNEQKIGDSLGQSIVDEQRKQLYMGPCPNCKKQLMMRASKFGGQFIGCSGYPSCTFTLPLPKMQIKKIGECEHCGYALMSTVNQRRKWIFCVNPQCPTRQKKEEEKDNTKKA